MGPELNVDLDEDPPASWTAVPIVIVERAADKATDRALRLRMTWQGRRHCDDLASEDLCPYVFGQPE